MSARIDDLAELAAIALERLAREQDAADPTNPAHAAMLNTSRGEVANALDELLAALERAGRPAPPIPSRVLREWARLCREMHAERSAEHAEGDRLPHQSCGRYQRSGPDDDACFACGLPDRNHPPPPPESGGGDGAQGPPCHAVFAPRGTNAPRLCALPRGHLGAHADDIELTTRAVG